MKAPDIGTPVDLRGRWSPTSIRNPIHNEFYLHIGSDAITIVANRLYSSGVAWLHYDPIFGASLGQHGSLNPWTIPSGPPWLKWFGRFLDQQVLKLQ